MRPLLAIAFALAACGTAPPPSPSDAAPDTVAPDAPPADVAPPDALEEAPAPDAAPDAALPDAAPDAPTPLDAGPDAAHEDSIVPGDDASADLPRDATVDADPCPRGETLCDRPGNPNACRNLLRGVLLSGMIYSCGSCNHACWVGARCIDGRCQ